MYHSHLNYPVRLTAAENLLNADSVADGILSQASSRSLRDGYEKSRVRNSGDFLQIERHTEAEVVQVAKAMFEASDRISGRLGCVTAGDFDSVVIKRVAQSEPVSRGIMLQVKMRRFFRRRAGVSRAHCQQRIGHRHRQYEGKGNAITVRKARRPEIHMHMLASSHGLVQDGR